MHSKVVYESSKEVHHDSNSIVESDIEVTRELTVLVIITMMGSRCFVPGAVIDLGCLLCPTVGGGRPFVIGHRHCTSRTEPHY